MPEPPRGTLYRIVVLSLLGVAVGTAASLAAIGFVEALTWLNDRLLISPYARIQYETRPLLVTAATLLVPALGGLLVGLLVRYGVAERRALGPPDAIYAVQTRSPPPTLASGLASTAAALVSLGAGASVGQYGPLVHLGAMLGHLASRLNLRVRNIQPIALACGVAAAISTAFNAPIAGLVFAHEVILRHYSLRAFAPVTVAAATGYVFANVIFERPALFLVSFDGVPHAHEFVLFAVQGMAGALLAAGFMAALLWASRQAARSPLPQPLRPAAAGLALGGLALGVPEVLGIGQETLRFATIEGAFAAGELGLLVAAKLAATVLCVAFGFVGGVFSPALLIGILFGAFCGSLVPLAPVPLEHSGVVVYAICGMMAVTSPVIGAPLTTILIVFELTRNYDLTIAAMVAVVFSNLVAYRIFGRSLFDAQLRRRGFDLALGRDKAILESRQVVDYLSRDAIVLPPGTSVAALLDALARADRAEATVVDADGLYRGTVQLQDATGADPATPVSALAAPTPVVFDRTTSVWAAIQALPGYLGEAVPLLDTDGRFLGVVPEEAVIRAYLDATNDLRTEENEAA
jgi:CIC family chloride channel protein